MFAVVSGAVIGYSLSRHFEWRQAATAGLGLAVVLILMRAFTIRALHVLVTAAHFVIHAVALFLLTLFYFSVLTGVGMLKRIVSKPGLDLNWDKNLQTYTEPADELKGGFMERPY